MPMYKYKTANIELPYPPAAYRFYKTALGEYSFPRYMMYTDDLEIIHDVPGQPHKGRVLLAIQSHSDDIPIDCGGLVVKLIKEGYTGYLLKMSADDLGGRLPFGQSVLGNENDNHAIAKALGCKKAFTFYYNNHRMDGDSILEMKTRMVYLLRTLKVDTIICHDPFNDYERNPDHIVSGETIHRACMICGSGKDFPEFTKAGIGGTWVRDKYYFGNSPQGHHLVNCVVDISSVIDVKVNANIVNISKGPFGVNGSLLRKRLAKENKKLPILGDNDNTANYQYIKEILFHDWRVFGKQFGLDYVEPYYHIGPWTDDKPTLQDYIDEHAVPLNS